MGWGWVANKPRSYILYICQEDYHQSHFRYVDFGCFWYAFGITSTVESCWIMFWSPTVWTTGPGCSSCSAADRKGGRCFLSHVWMVRDHQTSHHLFCEILVSMIRHGNQKSLRCLMFPLLTCRSLFCQVSRPSWAHHWRDIGTWDSTPFKIPETINVNMSILAPSG